MSGIDRDALIGFIRAGIADRIGAEAAEDADGDLFEAGLDSIDAVELSGEVEVRFGLVIDPTLMFERRSIREFTDAIIDLAAEMAVGADQTA